VETEILVETETLPLERVPVLEVAAAPLLLPKEAEVAPLERVGTPQAANRPARVKARIGVDFFMGNLLFKKAKND